VVTITHDSIHILTSLIASGQKIEKDTLKYVYYKDELGLQKKALIAYPKQILVIKGDSIYTILDENQLYDVISKGKGFNIINNPDSIQSFLLSRIKAIVILNKKD
jgi:hypothetical protein